MKYELNVMARIVLMQVIGRIRPEGSRLYHKDVGRVLDEISFSDDADKVGLKEVPDEKGELVQLKWDRARDYEKEVEIPERLVRQMRPVFTALDDAEQLGPEHIPVYDMFMEAVDEPGPDEKSS